MPDDPTTAPPTESAPESPTASNGAAGQETRHSELGWRLTGDSGVPGLTVLWHPDVERVGDRLALPQLAGGRDVEVSRLEPRLVTAGGALRPLDAAHLSRTPFRITAAGGGALRIHRGNCSSAIEVDGVPLDSERTVSAAEIDDGVVLLLAERVVLLLHRVDPSPPRHLPAYELIGESRAINRLRRSIASVADLEVSVLLRGETGSGKELVAEAVHRGGPRREQPFVAVNMGALPPTLAAAELFGAARGAYTGSQRERTGCFRQAHGGTLFLDEIGEAPAEVQVMLLRVLETGRVRSLGEDSDRAVDVRVIAATDSDLEEAVDDGRFRAPLLHRLGGYEIDVPPLRVRRDDIGRLLAAFLREELEELGEARRLRARDGGDPWLPAPLVARLCRLDWPGNVRQLRNVCRELAVLGRNRDQVEVGPQLARLLAAHEAATPGPALERAAAPAEPRFRRPGEVGEDELLEALAANRWRLKPTAEQLGISRTSLYDLIHSSPAVRTAAELSAEEVEESWRRHGGDPEAMVDELKVSREGILRRLRELELSPAGRFGGRAGQG